MARRAIVAFGILALLALLAAALLRLERLPEGPVPVAWDKTACAHCHMHVGEPAFAAQLQTKDGAVLHFDDPGCLLLHLDRETRDIHAIYFRHLREDRWIPADRVAFVEAHPSPMGHGLGAVDAGEPGAIDLNQARRRVRAGGALHAGDAP